MNYIQQLQQENAKLKETIETLEENISNFRVFLLSDKFQTKEGGERKDWIATSDVDRFLSEIARDATL